MASCFQTVMFKEIPNKHALMHAQETYTVGDIRQTARASDGHQAQSSP